MNESKKLNEEKAERDWAKGREEDEEEEGKKRKNEEKKTNLIDSVKDEDVDELNQEKNWSLKIC